METGAPHNWAMWRHFQNYFPISVWCPPPRPAPLICRPGRGLPGGSPGRRRAPGGAGGKARSAESRDPEPEGICQGRCARAPSKKIPNRDLETDPGHASRACSAALELRLPRGPSTRALQHLPRPFLTMVASPPSHSPSLFPRPAASPGSQTLEAQRSVSEQLRDVLAQGSPHPRLRPAHTRIWGGPKGSAPGQESLPRHLRESSSFVLWVLENCWQRAATGTVVSTFLRPSCTMKTKQKQWLEMLSAYHVVITVLFLSISSTILLFYLLFTSFWLISVLYFTWLFLDWDTPNQGGRSVEWIKNWAVWKHLRDYHSIKLVKTAELPPDQNYVFGSHPHGVLCFGSLCNFATESNNFCRKFPGLRPTLVSLNLILYFPVFREYLLSLGICSVNRQNLDFILSRSQHGQAVVIIVGGAGECLHTVPGEHHLILRNRKGFVRLALRHGASLVPVYSFGENDTFKIKIFAQDSWPYLWQIAFKKIVGISPCLFWGRSLFFANFCGLLTFPIPITTVVGRPIPVPQCLHPTNEEVDHYHKLYMKALQQLFEEHKESCGVPASTHLKFL
ncbi:2-acylglycerol O-acyltransferase 3 isoform 2-T2 [Glossophaga mutica]